MLYKLEEYCGGTNSTALARWEVCVSYSKYDRSAASGSHVAHLNSSGGPRNFKTEFKCRPKTTLCEYVRLDQMNVSIQKFKSVTRVLFVKRPSVFANSVTLNVIMKHTVEQT